MALVTKTFSDIITFTRTSGATYFDSNGVLQTAGNNVPRLDYNPATLAAQGLLIEEQRTNLLLYSEQFDNASGWTSARASVSANATTAPTGTSVADKIVEDTTASNTHLTFSADVSVSTATVYTYSVYAKAAGRTWFNMQIATGSGAYGATVPFCYFNLSGAGAIGTGAAATGSITSVGNGWYRCVLVATATTSASTTNIRIKLATADGVETYTGDGTSGIFVFGAQLEAGAFPTSYIPTTTTALTRSADVASVNTLSPWYNASEGTLFAESVSSVPSATLSGAIQPNIVFITDGTSNNRIGMLYNAGNVISARIVTAGATANPANILANLPSVNRSALAYAIGTNQGAFSVNESAVTTSSPANLPVVDRMSLGAGPVGIALNGYLRRITYYPRRLSNVELQALTV